MGKKRKRDEDDEEKIKKKIKKLESKLKRRQPNEWLSSDDFIENCESPRPTGESDSISMHTANWVPTITSPITEILFDNIHEKNVASTSADVQPLVTAESEKRLSENVEAEVAIDDETLKLFGNAPEPEVVLGKALHKEIAARWVEILKKGLSKEEKDKLSKEYLVPINCEILVAPILNPEAKAALTDPFIKRDSSLQYRQKQISISVSALAQAIEEIINNAGQDGIKHKILKPVSDACRILCDLHHTETNTRRKFVISSVNTSLRDTLVDSCTGKFLFGDNMSEKLKAAKTVQRSGQVLKVPQKSFSQNNKRLNYRSLHQKPTAKVDAGRFRPTQRQYNNNNFSRTAGRRSPPPPPPTRVPNNRKPDRK